jgi:hypothetical protein
MRDYLGDFLMLGGGDKSGNTQRGQGSKGSKVPREIWKYPRGAKLKRLKRHF